MPKPHLLSANQALAHASSHDHSRNKLQQLIAVAEQASGIMPAEFSK
jgi:hypothetical protein